MNKSRCLGILLFVFSAVAIGAGKGKPNPQGLPAITLSSNVTKLLQTTPIKKQKRPHSLFTKKEGKVTDSRHHFSAKIIPGSLKNNITRIAKAHGWKTVVWHAPNDYAWQGASTIRSQDLEGVMQRLLQHYPLQAVFYEGNHVLLIKTRNLAI